MADDPVAELAIDGWRQGIRFAASHMVPHHPKCGHLHGHTYAVNFRLRGTVPANGMIVDFGIVKEVLREAADELDHQWVLPREPADGAIRTEGDAVTYEVGEKAYRVPSADVTFIDVPVCTAEFLAHHFADRLMKQVEWPDQVTGFDVGIDEGYGKGAWASREP